MGSLQFLFSRLQKLKLAEKRMAEISSIMAEISGNIAEISGVSFFGPQQFQF